MNLLKLNDKNPQVKTLQGKLKKMGYYTGPLDGHFGDGTEKAVRAFQTAKGLMVDGVVGDKVRLALKGAAPQKWQLTDKDIAKAAKVLGVDIPSIRAVSEVESSGGGFHPSGEIKILFERHIMSKYLERNGLKLLAQIARKERPDLVNSKRGGYRGGLLENQRLAKACELNPEVAYQSISMGRYQIMGFHFKSLGFKSAIEMYKSLSKNEGAQLQAFCAFIKKNRRMHTALKNKDWAKFAKAYNGPKYAENKYDVKLAEAYKRHSA